MLRIFGIIKILTVPEQNLSAHVKSNASQIDIKLPIGIHQSGATLTMEEILVGYMSSVIA